jgi:hypothetical protein
MIELKDYRRNFQPLEVPDALVKLLEFANKQDDFFCSGFELEVDDKGGIRTWSDNPEFLNCLYPIGQANASGSTYAIWRQAGALGDAPIVVFGDEGGVHIVAANLAVLLRILTLDAEPMVDHESVIYYKDADAAEASEGAADYVEWLAKHFKLNPVTGAKEVEQIVKDAKKLHAKSFEAWFGQYYGG